MSSTFTFKAVFHHSPIVDYCSSRERRHVHQPHVHYIPVRVATQVFRIECNPVVNQWNREPAKEENEEFKSQVWWGQEGEKPWLGSHNFFGSSFLLPYGFLELLNSFRRNDRAGVPIWNSFEYFFCLFCSPFAKQESRTLRNEPAEELMTRHLRRPSIFYTSTVFL